MQCADRPGIVAAVSAFLFQHGANIMQADQYSTSGHGGRFFLPYQLHYTPAQLERAYPEIGTFFAAKRDWDPNGLFSNTWYARYAPLVAKQPAPIRPSITARAPLA